MTVWELIQELSAKSIDPHAHVQITGEEGDLTENFSVTYAEYRRGGHVLRIEAS